MVISLTKNKNNENVRTDIDPNL